MSLPSAMSVEEPAKHDDDRALVGRTIARKFKLLRLLGAGGMGAVYEAQDLLLGRHVALKLMKAAIASNTVLVQRFVREARAADSIQHKNIVRVLDLAADDETGSFYIVQELLSGESLAEKLDREGTLSSKEAVALIAPVLDALAAAHERGIVHRDVKPENVFLHREADGTITPKLIDFGISKVAESNAGLAKTQTGTALGTPYYMSPEQVRGDSSIDHRADQWSAGVMLFELVTGRRPFQGENYNLLILEIMTRRAPRADEVVPSVDRELASVIARALEPNREQRYEGARAFRQALEALTLDDAARISRVRDAALARADAPTIDAESAAKHSVVALGATIAADTTGAIDAARNAASSPVSETNAVAIAIAKAEPEHSATPAAKRPARGALFAGIALGAIVSIAAAASVSRSSANAHNAPPVVTNNAPSQQASSAAQTAHAAHAASTLNANANAATTSAALAADSGVATPPIVTARTSGTSARVRVARASTAVPAPSGQGAQTTQTTRPAQNPQPAQTTQATATQHPTTNTQTAGGTGFRPITTYP